MQILQYDDNKDKNINYNNTNDNNDCLNKDDTDDEHNLNNRTYSSDYGTDNYNNHPSQVLQY